MIIERILGGIVFGIGAGALMSEYTYDGNTILASGVVAGLLFFWSMAFWTERPGG